MASLVFSLWSLKFQNYIKMLHSIMNAHRPLFYTDHLTFCHIFFPIFLYMSTQKTHTYFPPSPLSHTCRHEVSFLCYWHLYPKNRPVFYMSRYNYYTQEMWHWCIIIQCAVHIQISSNTTLLQVFKIVFILF